MGLKPRRLVLTLALASPKTARRERTLFGGAGLRGHVPPTGPSEADYHPSPRAGRPDRTAAATAPRRAALPRELRSV